MKYPSVMSLTNLGGKCLRMLDADVEKLKGLSLWVTEKIHGENFKVGIDFSGEKYIGQRNQVYYHHDNVDGTFDYYLVGTVDKLHQRWNAISDETKAEIEVILKYIESTKKSMVFFGELFGKGLQKDFSFEQEGLHVRYFEILEENEFLRPEKAFEIFDMLGLKTVPKIGIMTVQEFLDFDVEKLESKVAVEKYVEGIVGVPVDGKPDWWDFADRLIIKKKIPRFAEQKQSSSTEKHNRYHSPFEEFVTETRMEHVIAECVENGLTITSEKECRLMVVEAFVNNIKEEENNNEDFSNEDRKALVTETHRLFSQFLTSNLTK